MQVSELGVWAQERSSAAADAHAAAAAESAAQRLLAELKAADAEAQEKLQDLVKCIADAAGQVSRLPTRFVPLFSVLFKVLPSPSVRIFSL